MKKLEGNPRKITQEQLETLKQSIERNKDYFEARPLILSNRTGELVVIAGNQRYEACRQLGIDECPTVLLEGLTEEREKEIIIRDNMSNGEWDEELLGEWDSEDLEDWGVDTSDMKCFEEEQPEAEEDDFDEESDQVDSVCKEGDLWKLGEHRLLCGDSTKANDVSFLMGGEKADMVFTDPPYGMKKEKDGVVNDNLNYDDLLEFNKKWIPLTLDALKDNGSWYCWGIDEPLMDIYSHILKPLKKNSSISIQNYITWDKGTGFGQNSGLMRSYSVATEKCWFIQKGCQGYNTNSDNYFEGFEPIRLYLENEAERCGGRKNWGKMLRNGMGSHYFTKSQWCFPTEEAYKKMQSYGKEYAAFKKEYEELKKEYEELKKEWYSTRAYFDNTHDNMNDVWHFARTSQTERELTGAHATPKPIALCSRGILSSSRQGEVVLDVFGGSGSTMMAAEQLGRKCFMIEYNPHYCDVIIARWEKLTGQKAVKIN